MISMWWRIEQRPPRGSRPPPLAWETWLAHDGDGLRLHSAQSHGTIVIHADFDAYVEEFYALAEAIALCSYEVVMFDEPGQVSTLLREKEQMTHEWEKPLGAVLNHLGLTDITLIRTLANHMVECDKPEGHGRQ